MITVIGGKYGATPTQSFCDPSQVPLYSFSGKAKELDILGGSMVGSVRERLKFSSAGRTILPYVKQSTHVCESFRSGLLDVAESF